MQKFRQIILAIILTFVINSCVANSRIIFLEAESFQKKGGWVIDNQAMDQMGSPFLLAHGLGIPVEDAETLIRVENSGKYAVWVRTRNWVAQ